MSTSNPFGDDQVKLQHIKTERKIVDGKSCIEWELPGGMIDVIAFGAQDSHTKHGLKPVPVYAVLVRLEGRALSQWPVIYTDNQDATRILILQLVKRIESALNARDLMDKLHRLSDEPVLAAGVIDPRFGPFVRPIHDSIMALVKQYRMEKDRKSAMLVHKIDAGHMFANEGVMGEVPWYHMTMAGLNKEKSSG